METGSFAYVVIRSSEVRGCLEVRSSVSSFSASNPEQSRKFHSRSRERNRVEGIRNIDKRTRFLPFGGPSEQRKSEASPPGRNRAAQFHEGPAGKTATEHGIEYRDSSRLEFNHNPLRTSFETTSNATYPERPLLQ